MQQWIVILRIIIGAGVLIKSKSFGSKMKGCFFYFGFSFLKIVIVFDFSSQYLFYREKISIDTANVLPNILFRFFKFSQTIFLMLRKTSFRSKIGVV